MTDQHSIDSLINSRILKRNIVYNLAGQVFPLLAAVIAIPLLINAIGEERFGLLSIGWMLVGYFGLFDLGLARVLTKMVGEKLGSGKSDEISQIIWSGLFFMLLLGIISAVIFCGLTPFLIHILNIPGPLLGEARLSFIILGCCIPIVTTGTGLRGILEAFQKFGSVNLVKSLNGILLFCAPLLIIQYTQYLPYYMLIIAGIRLLMWTGYAVLSYHRIGAIRKIILKPAHIRPMLKQGSWMSVSNIMGPVMLYFDRFFIGVFITIAAVTFYVTPYEIVSKTMMITAAFIRVLFPAFSTTIAGDPAHAGRLYNQGMRAMLIMFPVSLLIIGISGPGLRIWLGPEFAQSKMVAQWLALGCFINAPAQVAFIFIQASGRPDITAKLHLLEIPVYLLLFYFLIRQFGITGAAVAWTARMLLESILLLNIAPRFMETKLLEKRLYVYFSLAVCYLLLVISIQNERLQLIASIITALICIPLLFRSFRIIFKPKRIH